MNSPQDPTTVRISRSQKWTRALYPIGLFLAFVSFYLLTGGRERPWGDSQVMWEVAERIATQGRLDIAYEWPPMSHKGPNGLVYSQYALLASLSHLPGALLLDWLVALFPGSRGFWWPFCSHLAPACFGALTCVLFEDFCRRIGASRRNALFSTVAVGLGTILWVYARYSYSEALQSLCFLFLALRFFELHQRPSSSNALLFGLAGGMLVNAKLVYALSLLPLLLAVVLVSRSTPKVLLRRLLWIGMGALPWVVALLWYNWARWGSVFDTGYGETIALFNESPFWGAAGLLASPGKSVFLYSPPLVLGLWGWWRGLCQGKFRGVLLWIALSTLVTMLSYTRHQFWHGGWCWGPRYWVFATPILMLGFSAALTKFGCYSSLKKRTIGIALAISVFVTGASVQCLGNAFYWDHYIRIGKEVTTRWLGRPDRSGASIPERGRGHCDSCIEDLHALLWQPALSPISGHRWLLPHVVRQEGWKTAQRDAPWHRYTSKQINIKRSYRRARIDSWFLLWLKDHTRHRGLGQVLFGALLALWALGVGSLIWASLRESARSKPSNRF